MKRVSDVLLKVHALVLRGWCQDQVWAVDDEGFLSVSLYGAFHLLEAVPSDTNDTRERYELVSRAVRALRRFLDPAREYGGYLEDWNDMPGRTQEQVLDLVDSVIDSEMKREVG